MTTHILQAKVPLLDGPRPGTQAPVSLVDEVDFKWLMAGHGWWVDTTRLRRDPAYAIKFLRLALASGSPALRECALLLQAQLGAGDAADTAVEVSASAQLGAASARSL